MPCRPGNLVLLQPQKSTIGSRNCEMPARMDTFSAQLSALWCVEKKPPLLESQHGPEPSSNTTVRYKLLFPFDDISRCQVPQPIFLQDSASCWIDSKLSSPNWL